MYTRRAIGRSYCSFLLLSLQIVSEFTDSPRSLTGTLFEVGTVKKSASEFKKFSNGRSANKLTACVFFNISKISSNYYGFEKILKITS